MAAPTGHQYWKLAGDAWKSEKKFSSPEDLWLEACKYFEWMDSHPWHKIESVKAGDHFGKHVKTPTSRPYTVKGLCIFLNIHEDTLSNYEKSPGYETYFGVTKIIKDIIYTQKFEGAAVGAYNANIIARDLGLVDRKESKQTRTTVKLSGEERQKRIDELLKIRDADPGAGD